MNISSNVLALLKIKGVGPTKVLKFLEEIHFNSEIIKERALKYFDIELEELNALYIKAKNEIDDNKEKGIEIISILESDYPKKLYHCSNPILYLYYKGNFELLLKPSIGIIGTRNPTDQGRLLAKYAGEILASEGIIVISGLALGCDANAHMGALNSYSSTIAVLPSSLDDVVPKSNITLANKILEQGGCLISEYSDKSQFSIHNYPQRDRIVSSLSDILLVIEAGEKSGTMIAVNKSLNENKMVYQSDYNEIKMIKNKIKIEKGNLIYLADKSKKIQSNKVNMEQMRIF